MIRSLRPMSAPLVITRLLLCATGVPLGIAVATVVEQWHRVPAPDAGRALADAAVATPAPADDDLVALGARRSALQAELVQVHAALREADSRRDAAGLSRAQRDARQDHGDPLVDHEDELGLALEGEELLRTGLARRSDPVQSGVPPRQGWDLVHRLDPGPIAAPELALLGDGASLLALGRGRLVVVDRMLRVVRLDAALPTAPGAWSADAEGRRLLVGTTAGHLLAWRVADGRRHGPSLSDGGAVLAALPLADGWAVATADGIDLRSDELLPRAWLPWPGTPATHALVVDGTLVALAADACYRWDPARDGPATATPLPSGEPRDRVLASPDGRYVAWRRLGGTDLLDLGAPGATPRRLEGAPFAGWTPDGRLLTAAGGSLLARTTPELEVLAVLDGAVWPTATSGDRLVTGTDPCVLWAGADLWPLAGLRGGNAPLQAIALDPGGDEAWSHHADGRLWLWRRTTAP